MMTAKEEDNTPIGHAVDLLFKKRANLIDDYNGVLMVMSQSYSSDKYNGYCSELDLIHKELKFCSRILSLTRDQTMFAVGDLPTCDKEKEKENEYVTDINQN